MSNETLWQIYEFNHSKGLSRKSLLQTLRLNLPGVPLNEIELCEQRYRLSRALKLRRSLLIAQFNSSRAQFVQDTVDGIQDLTRAIEADRLHERSLEEHEGYRDELHEKLEAYAEVKEKELIEFEQQEAKKRIQNMEIEKYNRRKQARLHEIAKQRICAHKEKIEEQRKKQSEEDKMKLREIQDSIRKLILDNKPHIERRYRLLAVKEQRRKEKDREAVEEAARRRESLQRLIESVMLFCIVLR